MAVVLFIRVRGGGGGISSARFRRIPSKAPSYPSGLTCLRGVRLGDFIFGQRLAVTILTAASGTQEFPAVGDIALDEFLNLLDMGGADNLVVGELLHGRGGYQEVARSAIAKAQIHPSHHRRQIQRFHRFTQREIKVLLEKFPAALLAFFRRHYQFRLVRRIQASAAGVESSELRDCWRLRGRQFIGVHLRNLWI